MSGPVVAERAGDWDDVLVGAGSAGSVLAARLSQRPDRRVLLLEAGQDEAARPDAPVLRGHNWDYEAVVGAGSGDRRVPYRVGKVVGGSSAVNGAIALRGLACDFAQWAEAGCPDWAWAQVLPYFRAIETDQDFGGAAHGAAGPIPIRRRRADDLGPMAAAFWQACRTRGLADVQDLNAGSHVGVGPTPTNIRGGRRMSTVDTHLSAARGRPNLAVWDGTWVRRVLFAGGRAVGVELVRHGRPVQVRARRVTLCAGAVNTPAILCRSGLGAACQVARAGVPHLVDLPGVGENLLDHPTVAIWSVPRPAGRDTGGGVHPVLARLALAGGEPDASLTVVDTAAVPGMPGIGRIAGGRVCVSVAAALLAPASRGTVELREGEPDGPPLIRLRLASAPADLDRLVQATRFAWSVVRTPAVADLLERTFVWTDRMVDDDALIRAAVPRFVAPMWHAAGTARMGPAGDPMAVVDQHCRVHGVAGLRVVDASVMPSIPRGTPNLTCVVIAERAAEWMDRVET